MGLKAKRNDEASEIIEPTSRIKRERDVDIEAIDVRNNNRTFAISNAPGNLMHPGQPYNKFSSKRYNITLNQYSELAWRPTVRFQSFLRTRNTTTGILNPSTSTIDLDSGTGTHNNGDVFVITWKQKGNLNNNIEEIVLWLGTSAADAASDASFVRVALFDITSLSIVAPPALDAPGVSGVGITPLNLDHLNYSAASQLAYAEVPFNSVPLIANGGGPIRFQLCYNARETRSPEIEEDKVYAIAVYLLKDAADNTHNIKIYGSNVAVDDPYSATYVGAAGWNGILAVDATCKAAYYQLLRTGGCSINQINIFADATQDLGDMIIEKIVVQPDNDDAILNTILENPSKKIYSIEAVSGMKLGSQVQHSIVFEGKIEVPRRYFLKIILFGSYTGDVTIQCNHWIEPRGDAVYVP